MFNKPVFGFVSLTFQIRRMNKCNVTDRQARIFSAFFNVLLVMFLIPPDFVAVNYKFLDTVRNSASVASEVV